MKPMSEFSHPDLNDVSLAMALHALSDPARLSIVQMLERSGELCCEEALPSGAVPKSTRSHHFKVLRCAGILLTRKHGRHVLHTLRRADIDTRFPGLLDAVLRSADAPLTERCRQAR